MTPITSSSPSSLELLEEALRATIGATTVLVVFELSEDDAKRTEAAAEKQIRHGYRQSKS